MNEFSRSARDIDGHTSACLECYRVQNSKWGKENKELANARSREWRLNNLERSKNSQRKYHLRTTYGMTQEQYDELHSSQDGRCAICGCEEIFVDGKSNLHIDHCHESNQVRGLLCFNCNVGLGNFKDDKERLQGAISYLEMYGS